MTFALLPWTNTYFIYFLYFNKILTMETQRFQATGTFLRSMSITRSYLDSFSIDKDRVFRSQSMPSKKREGRSSLY